MRGPIAQSEDELSREIHQFFADELDKSDFKGIVGVGEKQQVLMNLTIGRDPKSRGWRYYFGLQQQDIVFYLLSEGHVPVLSESPATYHWLAEPELSSRKIRVPLLACELKLKRNVNTHQLITYSRIAEQVRDVHPHCGYFLIVGGAGSHTFMPETVLRQAKGFNRVFLNWETEHETIWSDILSHLCYLRDRAKLIGGGEAA